MSYVSNTFLYETAEGEQKKERFRTNKDNGNELRIDEDGDILGFKTVEVDGEEKEFCSLYIPQHRLVKMTAEVIER